MTDRYYQLTPPAGKPFFAKIDDAGFVYSTRSGQWQIDPKLLIADLVMPEYKLYDWTVEKLQQPPPDAG